LIFNNVTSLFDYVLTRFQCEAEWLWILIDVWRITVASRSVWIDTLAVAGITVACS